MKNKTQKWWQIKNELNGIRYLTFVISIIFSSLFFVWLSQNNYYVVHLKSIKFYFNWISVSYIIYYIFRIIHSYLFHKKYTHKKSIKSLIKNYYNKKLKVGVIVPFYNEDIKILKQTILALLKQSHENTYIYVLNDGSNADYKYGAWFSKLIKNKKLQNKLYYFEFKKNRGKRHVMYDGFKQALTQKVDFIVTVDSDTILHKDAIKNLVATINSSNNFGSVTGHVLSMHTKKGNLLERLIAVRYLTAFNFERASQAHYGGINCNSGPLTIYRADLIKKIMNAFVTQKFMGTPSTYGDDRHLTNLVLLEGYKTGYQPFAFAFTDTPNNLWHYLKQQYRWSKSYIRELLWQAELLLKHSFWLTSDYVMHLFLPLFLIYNFLGNVTTGTFVLFSGLFHLNLVSYYTFHQTIFNIMMFFVMLILAALIRALYLDFFIRKKIPQKYMPSRSALYFYTILYAFLFISVLIFLKPVAAIFIKDNSWSTR